ncbi:MAG: tetratricopeptide repeat protein [Abitibacteriaceae bacterium]|nr:tetratricopeptide repeat protein [Abditibacteriaceae bacterium]MBV9866920.1 tetratricopeptide repeat protein [Abditibacteriaceae bacterium]
MLPFFKRPVADSNTVRADILWRQGSKLLEQRKYDKAISSMREAYEIEPTRLEGRLNLGAALYLTQHYEEAATHLNYVLAFDPQNSMALLNLAACYDALGRMDQSIATLEKLVADRPQWKDAHYNLGVAYFKQELYEKAVDALKAELQLTPNHEAARTLLNKIYLLPPSKTHIGEAGAPSPAVDSLSVGAPPGFQVDHK